MTENVTEVVEAKTISEKDKNPILIMYIAALGSAVISIIPIFAIVGILVWIGLVVFAYIKKGDAKSPDVVGHYSNYITVFWIGLLLTLIGLLFMVLFFPLGILMMLGVLGWEGYRLIKGLVRILDNRAYS